MHLLRLAGSAAVICGGLVLGAGFADLTDGAASVRPGALVASHASVAIARNARPAHAVRRPAMALRVIGLPRDGTHVPERLVPPSLRGVFETPATYATTGADAPMRLRPRHGRSVRRLLGRA